MHKSTQKTAACWVHRDWCCSVFRQVKWEYKYWKVLLQKICLSLSKCQKEIAHKTNIILQSRHGILFFLLCMLLSLHNSDKNGWGNINWLFSLTFVIGIRQVNLCTLSIITTKYTFDRHTWILLFTSFERSNSRNSSELRYSKTWFINIVQ